MDDALGVMGIFSQVRFVYPRTDNAFAYPSGSRITGWTGLWNTTGANVPEARNLDFRHAKSQAFLVYLDPNGNPNLYEACCFVHMPQNQGGAQRYYGGAFNGNFEETAYKIWKDVTNNGASQRWEDMLNAPDNSVPGPKEPPPNT
jgi:hypothetical protein